MWEWLGVVLFIKDNKENLLKAFNINPTTSHRILYETL